VSMDEGLPIAYPVLGSGVPVISSDGEQVGKVDHVVAAIDQDIFHGLVISTPRLGKRFIPAEDIASLHERGVDLRIKAEAVAEQPAPGGGSPEYSEDPAEDRWEHWVHKLTGRKDWKQVR
jgi:sporulation protein YlmC with PRC-barrel domain